MMPRKVLALGRLKAGQVRPKKDGGGWSVEEF